MFRNHKSKRFRRHRLRLETLESRRLLAVDLVSVIPSGTTSAPDAGNDYSTNPEISANGRFIAFQSHASDLVSGVADSNETQDVFVRDLLLGTTSLISVNASGTDSGSCGGAFCGASITSGSFSPAISDDGRYVVFVSRATDLVKDVDIDVTPNVYIRDRDVDEDGIFDEPGESVTTLLSIASDGTAAGTVASSDFTARPVISADGKFVAFASAAPDLLVDSTTITDTNGAGIDVYRADVATGTLSRINVDGSGAGTGFGGGSLFDLSMSGSGSLVGFATTNSGLVTAASGSVDDTNGGSDIFVGGGNTPVELVSINADGTGSGNGRSREPAISRNGRHVAFFSFATDLVSGISDDNLSEDLFVRDLTSGRTTLLSVARGSVPLSAGDGATPSSSLLDSDLTAGPAISDTGRFVAFRTAADNLLDPSSGIVDDNGRTDIYVVDRDSDMDGRFDEPGATELILVTVNAEGTGAADHTGIGLGTAGSSAPSISGDGRYVSFASTGLDLIPGGAGIPGSKVYVRDLVTGVTTLVSETAAGGDVAPTGTTPATRLVTISRDGSRVAFQTDRPASDLDATVLDSPSGSPVTFGEVDVFVGTPDADLRLPKNYASGNDEHIQGFQVLFEEVAPFEISYFRSLDREFDDSDELLGSVAVSDPVLLLPASPSKVQVTTIGTGAGEVPFPGVGSFDFDDDYFILAVADPTNSLVEFDGDPFNEDNTDQVRGVYHVPSAPVFVQGSDGGDVVSSEVLSGELFELTYGATNSYPVEDVTETRVRLHAGDDLFTGSSLVDFVFGGAGSDTLMGLAGNDTLFGGEGRDVLEGGEGADELLGGPGADILIGGPGDDVFFDGPGDDLVDVGPGDDIVFATPGSDDIFIGSDDVDTIDFSLDDLAITIDLDTEAIQRVDGDGNTVQLIGLWDNFVGSPIGNDVTVRPVPGKDRVLRGGDGDDSLVVNARGNVTVDDGTKLTFPGSGFGDILYSGFENVRVIQFAVPDPVIDNGDSRYSSVGFTTIDNPSFPQGLNGDIEFADPSDSTPSTATWTFGDLPPARYLVAATWTNANDRASDAPFDVLTDGSQTWQRRINQEQEPGEFSSSGVDWTNLGIVEVTGNTLTVQLTDDADEFVVADAIRIEPIYFGAEQFIVDDMPNRDSQSSAGRTFQGTNTPFQNNTALIGFATDIGGTNNGSQSGTQDDGYRLINWSQVPDGGASNSLASNFYNTLEPRGAVIGADGLLTVSSAGANDTPEFFANLNASYEDAFGPFPPQRLFTPIGTNVTDVRFFVPGTSTPAAVSGFGAIFSDVDLNFESKIDFFDASGNQIDSQFALAAPGDGNKSFVGVNFDDPIIASVRITTGNAPLLPFPSPDDITQGGLNDLVVLDDFIFGEPVALPDSNQADDFESNCLARSGPGFLGDTHVCSNGQSAVWTFDDLSEGSYLVSTTWTPSLNNSDQASYQVVTRSELTDVVVNQTTPPASTTISSLNWRPIAKIRVDEGDFAEVSLLGNTLSGESVIADAVQLVRGADLRLIDPFGSVIEPGATVDLGKIPIGQSGAAIRGFDFKIQNRVGAGVLEVGQGFSNADALSIFPFDSSRLPSGSETPLVIQVNTDSLGAVNGELSFSSNDFDHPDFRFNVTLEVVEDTTPPEIEVQLPNESTQFVEGQRILVTGNVSDDISPDDLISLFVEGQPVEVFPDGTFQLTDFALPIDSERILFEARDEAGNTTQLDHPLDLVNDEPPQVQLLSPFDGDGVVTGSTIPIRIDAVDDVGLRQVELLVDGNVVATTTQEPFLFRFQVPELTGFHHLQACATDSFGNVTCDDATVQSFDGPLIKNDSIVVGPKSGAPPKVSVFGADGTLVSSFFAYDPGFTGGVRVATGDVNGDGTADIVTAPGPGGGPHVKVFDGVSGSLIRNIQPFPQFSGGVFVAAGDVTGDGFDDLIVGPGPGGGPHVKVFSAGHTEVVSFEPYSQEFLGGVRVAVGDIDGDAVSDIVYGPGSRNDNPELDVRLGVATGFDYFEFSSGVTNRSLFDIDGENFDSELFLYDVGDTTGDLADDVILVGEDDQQQSLVVQIDNSELNDALSNDRPATGAELFALPDTVEFSIGDIDGDGQFDILGGSGPGVTGVVYSIDGDGSIIESFTPIEAFTGGVFVAGVAPRRIDTVTLPETGGDSSLDVEDDDLVIRDADGNVVSRVPKDALNDLRLRGAGGVNDTLVVRGIGETPRRVIYDGGALGFDEARIEPSKNHSNQTDYLRYRFDSPLITSLTTDRSADAISFEYRLVGLEPIFDSLDVKDREFVFPASDDTVVFGTGQTDTDNVFRIDGDRAEVVDFEAPTDSTRVRLGAGQDVFRSDLAGHQLPNVDGGDGFDTIVLTRSGIDLDWTQAGSDAPENIEQLSIAEASSAHLSISASTVAAVTDADNTLIVAQGEGNSISYSDDGWSVQAPIFAAGAQRHVLTNDGSRLEVINSLPFQNPLNATDVNFNGETTPIDALQIINFLARNEPGGVDLLAPADADELPERYYDSNGSGTASPIDALIVINFIARQLNAGEPETTEREGATERPALTSDFLSSTRSDSTGRDESEASEPTSLDTSNSNEPSLDGTATDEVSYYQSTKVTNDQKWATPSDAKDSGLGIEELDMALRDWE